MDLKYATLGLISGYLAGYVQDCLQTKNTVPNNSTASADNFTTTLSDEEDNI